MITRQALTRIELLSRQFPAVLILGPRQCGKTTLARHFLEGEYFDLQKPSDIQVFLGDAELALRRLRGKTLILDEAQVLPELFPVLRALIDKERWRTGAYYLLGSVNPALMRHTSESLAGRVGVVELTPFLAAEALERGVELEGHWLSGGFPDACGDGDGTRWRLWHENYLATFLERDIAQSGLRSSPIQMRRLMVMLAHHHGGVLNLSDLGRSLGISYHAVNDRLDVIEGHYLVRRLPPYHINVGKRIVKAPKLYVRDTGVLHQLLGISTERQLLESPRRGASWEGFVVEQLIGLDQLADVGSRYSFYRTHAGAEIDLVIDRGHERVGYEIKCASSVGPRDIANLRAGLADGVIHRAFVVYLGERDYSAAERIEVVSAHRLRDGLSSRLVSVAG